MSKAASGRGPLASSIATGASTESRLPAARVYLVTDRTQTRGRPLLEVVGAALRGGVRLLQLREHGLSTRQLLALAESLRVLTAAHGAALLVNDRIDVALACGADGVHLPARSFTVRDARALLGPDRLIGVSTHRLEEVAAATAQGADFIVFGPVFSTPSKERYGPPLGPAALARACVTAATPVFAIGGVSVVRVRDLRGCGAHGVAVIRAVLAADDPQAAAQALVRAVQNA